MQKIEVKIAGKAVGYIRQLGGLWVAITYGDLYSPPMFGSKNTMLEYVKTYGNARTTSH